jgi:hypothetical protein
MHLPLRSTALLLLGAMAGSAATIATTARSRSSFAADKTGSSATSRALPHDVASAFGFSGPQQSAATSSLTQDNARSIAEMISTLKPDTGVTNVLATGSMKPVFGENVILLSEQAPFSTLKVGDIVTYRYSNGMTVVHRLVAKDGNKFWARGDANPHRDDTYVTQENYLRRVYGILYTK